MRGIRAWLQRLAEFFSEARIRSRISQPEMQSHLQLHIDENLQRGMSQKKRERMR